MLRIFFKTFKITSHIRPFDMLYSDDTTDDSYDSMRYGRHTVSMYDGDDTYDDVSGREFSYGNDRMGFGWPWGSANMGAQIAKIDQKINDTKTKVEAVRPRVEQLESEIGRLPTIHQNKMFLLRKIQAMGTLYYQRLVGISTDLETVRTILQNPSQHSEELYSCIRSNSDRMIKNFDNTHSTLVRELNEFDKIVRSVTPK